jgi:hypothetical protein
MSNMTALHVFPNLRLSRSLLPARWRITVVRTLPTMTRAAALMACLLAAHRLPRASAQTITPDNPGPADLQFTVSSAAPARPISPYIYGVNFSGSSGFTNPVTLDRLGGNRWTGYNW